MSSFKEDASLLKEQLRLDELYLTSGTLEYEARIYYENIEKMLKVKKYKKQETAKKSQNNTSVLAEWVDEDNPNLQSLPIDTEKRDLVRHAFIIGSKCVVHPSEDLTDKALEIYSKSPFIKSDEVMITYFVTPLLQQAWKRYKTMIELLSIGKISVAQKCLFQFIALCHEFNIHNKVILNFNLHPQTEYETPEVHEKIKENAEFVLVLYTAAFVMYHSKNYSVKITEANDKILRNDVYTHFSALFELKEDWRKFKLKVFLMMNQYEICRNIEKIFNPWVNEQWSTKN